MNTSQTEILHSQMNVKNQNTDKSNSSKLIEREQIEGSPYWIIGNEEKGYFITFGKWQLSDAVETKLDAILLLEKEKYNIILKTILCIIKPTSLQDNK